MLASQEGPEVSYVTLSLSLWKWTLCTVLELEETVAMLVLRALKRKSKMWAHAIICARRNKGLFWTIFEDLRTDKAKYFNYFRMSVDFWRTVRGSWAFSAKSDTNIRKYSTERDVWELNEYSCVVLLSASDREERRQQFCPRETLSRQATVWKPSLITLYFLSPATLSPVWKRP